MKRFGASTQDIIMQTNANYQNNAPKAGSLVDSVERAIGASRLYKAIELVQKSIDESSYYELRSKLASISQTYSYLISFLFGGQADPGREAMYAELCAATLHLADMCVRAGLIFADPSPYYATIRNLGARRASLSADIGALAASRAETALMPDSRAAREKYEAALEAYFNSLWTAVDLRPAEADRLVAMITDQDSTPEIPMMTVGALLLGSLQFFEPEKLRLLIKAYPDAPEATQAYILTSVLQIAQHHRSRLELLPDAADMLAGLMEIPGTPERLRTILMISLRTRDTDRVTTKMTQEVVPEIMKLQPEIMKRLKDAGKLQEGENTGIEINPEWEDLIERSGLADKLRELTDMQAEGADVMMLAFSNLKGFPFFRKVSNWIRPFAIESTEATSVIDAHGSPMRNLLQMNGMLCDSDIFSFVLAIPHMPEQQKEFLNKQLEAQAEAMQEDAGTSLSASTTPLFEREALRFMRNLFRFFRLYPQRQGLPDPFSSWSDATATPVALADVLDVPTLEVVAEFLFRRRYYAEALEVYTRLMNLTQPDGATLEKIGFCHQVAGRIEEAIETYKRAEYTRPNSLWLIRRLATLLYDSGHFGDAVPYLRRALEKKPDSPALAMKLGHALLESDNREEALRQYYKVEYEHPERTDARRAIAWTLLLEGKYEESRAIYDELLLTDACPSDYLDAGHLALIQGRFGEAAALYREGAKMSDGGAAWLSAEFAADMKHLTDAGVKRQDAMLLLDGVCHELSVSPEKR